MRIEDLDNTQRPTHQPLIVLPAETEDEMEVSSEFVDERPEDYDIAIQMLESFQSLFWHILRPEVKRILPAEVWDEAVSLENDVYVFLEDQIE
jgi:hypothetical protein